MRYLAWLWHYSRGIRANILVRIVAGTGRVGLSLLMVLLCKRFIDVTIHTGTPQEVVLMIGALTAVVFGSIICRQLYYYLGVKAGVLVSTSLRLQLFSHLFRRQMFTRHDMHSGDITSRLEKDIDVVSDTLTSVGTDLTVTAIQLVGAFMLMQSMDRRLAWVLLLATPLFLVTGKLIARKMRQLTLAIRKQESIIQMMVQETMEHNAVLRSMESGGWVTERLDGIQQGLRQTIYRRARFTVVSRTVIATSFSLGYVIAFVWGALQLREGLITFGVMTSFLQLVNQIQQPILQMLNMLPQVIHASASIDRLEELKSMESEGDDAADGGDDRRFPSPPGVRVQGVSFRYASGDRQILDSFSHDFRPGSKVALMGTTGAGKTTLFRLMLALVKPAQGQLVVYGGGQEMPVSKHTRTQFIFVPQGNTLMSGTIRYNLLLANPGATDEEMRQALHTAMADFVLQLPDGIDSECGERGGGLSEGQAQRIAIARGLLRPGGILLLDEISSSLDAQTEQELYRRLFEAYPGRTMIFITHRPAVCDLCDETVML